jgi:hypothetical protein
MDKGFKMAFASDISLYAADSDNIFGRKENVLMAEYVFDFLKNYIFAKGAEKKKQEGHFPASMAKAYHLGILTGFDEKLAHQCELIENADVKQSLAVFSKDPQIKQYIAKIHPRLISVASQARLKNRDIFDTGRKEGQSLTIHRPMESNGSKKIAGLFS